MTAAERIEAIRAFGYTEREAAFLAAAMLHGGYFVARQFTMSTGASPGKAVARLTGRLLARGHARVIETHREHRVYHVSARRLYAALNASDDGNWRTRSPTAIKTRLMGLDYVLGHPGEEFLGSHSRRAEYLAGVLGINRDQLPGRQLADRSQLGIVNGATPGLSFVYLAGTGSSLPGFRRYLREHRAVFAALTAGRVVFASDSPRLFSAAAAVFAQFSGAAASSRSTGFDARALLEYFRIRRGYEMGQLDGFTKTTLDQLREDRQRFRGPRIESAYEQWKAGGDGVVGDAVEMEQPSKNRADVRFETYWLKHSYTQCGTRSD